MTGVDLQTSEGFRRMYREHLGYVHAVLQRLGAPVGHLEDLCHDVFMTAFRKRADFDPQRPLKPWLFGLAFRLTLNAKRKSSATGDEAPLMSLHDGRANPEQAYAEQQARGVLGSAIARLVPERRAVFLMHDVEGHAAPDIARELEIPVNTAYTRLRLARADLLEWTKGLRAGGMT